MKAQLLQVLRDYMSGILAGSVINLAVKWSGVDLESLEDDDGKRLLEELEKGVRLYVTAGGERAECLRRLEQQVVGGDGAETSARKSAPWRPSGGKRAGETKKGSTDDRYSVEIVNEVDVLAARGASREIAAEAGLGAPDQVRVATVISELARHILHTGGAGRISIAVLWRGRRGVEITAVDPGLDFDVARQVCKGGDLPVEDDLLGIAGARKLMDDFEVESSEEGGCVLRLRRYV
jgi:serine/threonine-protein kinase RsbT